jgi:hypothetical protein
MQVSTLVMRNQTEIGDQRLIVFPIKLGTDLVLKFL